MILTPITVGPISPASKDLWYFLFYYFFQVSSLFGKRATLLAMALVSQNLKTFSVST